MDALEILAVGVVLYALYEYLNGANNDAPTVELIDTENDILASFPNDAPDYNFFDLFDFSGSYKPDNTSNFDPGTYDDAAYTNPDNYVYTGPSGMPPKGYKPPPPEIDSAIRDAAAKVGVDPEFLLYTAWLESRWKTSAVSDTNAKGLFQFIPSSWTAFTRKYGAPYGIDEYTSPTDINANSIMGAFHAKEGIDLFRNNFGRDPSYGELYTFHFLGPDATKLVRNPNASMAELFPRFFDRNWKYWSKTNESAFSEGGRLGGRPLLAREVIAKHESYFK